MKSPNVYLFPDFVEHLDETAHVRPLEMMKETYVHAYRGIDLLGFASFVKDGYWVFKSLDAHFLYVDISLVF